MYNRDFVILILPILATLCGCFDRVAGGAGVGNPPLAEVTVALEAKSAIIPALAKISPTPNPTENVNASGITNNRVLSMALPGSPLSIKDSMGTSITLTGIEILVDKLEFSLPDTLNCEDNKGPCLEHEIGLNGKFKLDLISAKSTPAIGVLKIPTGIYEKIGLTPAPADSIPGSTRPRYNFLLTGKVGNPGLEKAFSMEIDLEDGLDFIDPKGIKVVKDSLTKISLSLTVDGWFAGVNLLACMESIPADSSGLTLIRGNGPCRVAVGRVGANTQESEDIEDEVE
jgi:hypothetical protein